MISPNETLKDQICATKDQKYQIFCEFYLLFSAEIMTVKCCWEMWSLFRLSVS